MPPEPAPLPEPVLRQWLLPAVYERMRTGRGEFLAELRTAVPLFLRFGGIDYDSDPDAEAKLDAFIVAAQRIVDGYGGSTLQLTLGDKGCYLYAVFGTPLAHEDDTARACAAALELLTLSRGPPGHRAADRTGPRPGPQRHLRPRDAADLLLPGRPGQPGRPADDRRAGGRDLRLGRGARRGGAELRVVLARPAAAQGQGAGRDRVRAAGGRPADRRHPASPAHPADDRPRRRAGGAGPAHRGDGRRPRPGRGGHRRRRARQVAAAGRGGPGC